MAIGAFGPIAIADPAETDPDLATRDADYAAGKKAVDKKDWAQAVRNFQKAAVLNPDSADLHNYLGYSYRNLKRRPASKPTACDRDDPRLARARVHRRG